MDDSTAPGEADLIAEQQRQLEALRRELRTAQTWRQRLRLRRRIRVLLRRSFNGEMLRW